MVIKMSLFVVFNLRSNRNLNFALACYVSKVFFNLEQFSLLFSFSLPGTLPFFKHPGQLAYRISYVLYFSDYYPHN